MDPTRRSRPILAGLGGLALAVLVACSTVEPPQPQPQVGSLSVAVVGLPQGVPARAQLVSSAGASLDVTGTAVFDDLEVGAYEVVVDEVCRLNVVACPEVERFVPETERIPVDVRPGQTGAVEIVYQCELLEPPDPVLAALLLDAVRAQTGDPADRLTCALVANVTELEWTDPSADRVVDLEGLQYARRLERLAIVPQGVTDLTPLAGLVELRELVLGDLDPSGGGLAADLAPILDLPKLADLRIPSGPFDAIPDLTGLPSLRRLAIDGAQLADLTPLAQAPLLESFEARGCYTVGAPGGGIEDLTPLAGLTQLRRLDLWCQRIEDLTPLAGLITLEYLEVGSNGVRNLTPLAGLGALTYLGIQVTEVASLEVVRGLPLLEQLTAAATFVRDVRPLHLHQIEFGTLRTVGLNFTCVEPQRVPAAWYLADLAARGVSVSASTRDGCATSAAPTPTAVATFELDDEGWTTSGDAGALRRLESGGRDGGPYLEADDLQGGVTWYWEAPEKFFGDAGDFLGGALEVTLRQSATDNQFANANDVILAGAGMVLAYDVSELVGTTWTGLLVPLTTLTDDGWQIGGTPADEAMLAAVLADLTRVAIRGEYRTGADTGGIAYFALVADGR